MKKIRKLLKYLLIGLFAFVIINEVWLMIDPPSLDRDWAWDQSVLADISFDGDIVSARDVRNFDYSSASEYSMHYYDETYDITKLERMWYIIEPFGEQDGPAHTMLSFDFSDGKYLSVSTEIRKELGESFSAVK